MIRCYCGYYVRWFACTDNVPWTVHCDRKVAVASCCVLWLCALTFSAAVTKFVQTF